MILVHIDGMFDGVFIGRPPTEYSIACESQQRSALIHCADHRIPTGPLVGKPSIHSLRRKNLVLVERGRIQNRFVENVEDRSAVNLQSAVNELHGFLPSSSRLRVMK